MKKASKIYQHLNQITMGISYLQIKEFTMQINYHQRFVYSACNFFFIDYRLLFSVNDKLWILVDDLCCYYYYGNLVD
jgi:hypothetical protein